MWLSSPRGAPTLLATGGRHGFPRGLRLLTKDAAGPASSPGLCQHAGHWRRSPSNSALWFRGKGTGREGVLSPSPSPSELSILGECCPQKGVLKVTSAGPRLSRAVGCMDERLNPAHRGVCGPGFGSMTFMSCCWSAICSGHHCLLLKLFLGVSRGHVQVVTRAGSSWGRPALLGQLLPAAGSELHDPGAGPLRPLAPSASSHGKHALCMHVGGGVMGRKSGREPRVLNTY